jgi:hypothetical protein
MHSNMQLRSWTCCILLSVLAMPYVLGAEDDVADSQTVRAPVTPIVGDTGPNSIRCKKIQMTGTHFRKRVCHTRGEWEAMRVAALETMKQRGSEAEGDARNRRYGY